MTQVTTTPNQLGQALRQRRKARGLSQEQAGALVGLRQKTVSALELNPDRCRVESLFRLLAALELELSVQPRPDADAAWTT